MLAVVSHQEKERSSSRMCAGCRNRDDRAALVRLVFGDRAPFVAADLARKLPGRGVSLHPRRSCVRRAVQRGGLAKAFGRQLDIEPEVIERALVQQYVQRISGLLQSAGRIRCVELGADAVHAALRAGRKGFLLFAEDARGRREELVAEATRRAVPVGTWGTKETLGRVFGRSELGVLLIANDGIAAELARCASSITALSEDE